MSDQWIVRVNDREYGPADLATLREWQRDGRLIATNEIRRANSADWQLAGAFEELFPRPAAPVDSVVRRRRWGEIIRETLRIYARGFPQFLLLALLTAVPSFFLQQAVPFVMPTLENPTPQLPPMSATAIALFVAVIALWPISAAGLQLVADGVAHKQRPRWRDLLRNALSLWPRMLVLGFLVYGCFAFWIIVPFAALFSLASEPSVLSLLLIVVIGAFTIYINARLFVNFLFWQQTAALTQLHGLDALRESKRLARSRRNEMPRDQPLYRGATIASTWVLLLIAASAAAEIPFVVARFVGVTDPNQAIALAQQLASAPRNDALTFAANAVSALVHVLLRPLLAAAFVVLYYDARAGAGEPE